MTKDEIAELRRCSDELLTWLGEGMLPSLPPLETIRTIALLANKAANTIEALKHEPRRSWLFDPGGSRR